MVSTFTTCLPASILWVPLPIRGPICGSPGTDAKYGIPFTGIKLSGVKVPISSGWSASGMVMVLRGDALGNLLVATGLRMMAGYSTRERNESCGCLTTGGLILGNIRCGMDGFLRCLILNYQNLSLQSWTSDPRDNALFSLSRHMPTFCSPLALSFIRVWVVAVYSLAISTCNYIYLGSVPADLYIYSCTSRKVILIVWVSK